MADILDVSRLETMTSGDAALAAEALGIFRQSYDLWGRMLDPHLPQQQWADAAHGIKGAALSIGAMALGEACAAAEQLGKSGKPSPAQAGVAISTIKDRMSEATEAIAELEHHLLIHRAFPKARPAS